ncbi:hypothetical protein ACFQ07_34290 [Actinomadura adrarensis]|uniref:DNA methylase adenine-specific domain-containing protein n=1 Tax=Actinomadura adrarensis TaxID=1819600 RepID=A0ABW3CS30_9ACTN
MHAALNGQAAGQLRELVPAHFRREQGAYFTSGEIKDRFTALLDARDLDKMPFWDATCGAGDLLLAACARLTLKSSLSKTLDSWSRLLYGQDLQPEFVRAARLRLFVAAAAQHRKRGDSIRTAPEAGAGHFDRVQAGDGLDALRSTTRFRGHILLNPPFGLIEADRDCTWSTGATAQAGVFLLAGARALAPSYPLTAILPDVLRSGSRYRAWRAEAEGLLDIEHIIPLGRFDRHTDVDVFLLSGTRRRPGSSVASPAGWWPDLDASVRLEEIFDIRVGPVVDNRDPHDGPAVPFLTARCMPVEGLMGEPPQRRAFAGRLLKPPFVAVRRTSRPDDSSVSRARGILVTGENPIAVDNHVITLKPHSGSDHECAEVLEILASERIARWLDDRIRCRHLTVGVLRSLPWR